MDEWRGAIANALTALVFLAPSPVFAEFVPYRPDPYRHDCSYPPIALIFGEEGRTQLSVRVSAAGNVTSSIISKSSGSIDLDRASKACVSHWRYHATVGMRAMVQQVVIVWKDRRDRKSPIGISGERDCARFYRSDILAPRTNGETILSYSISPQDRLEGVTIAKSSGNARLDRAALRCVDQMHPAMRPGGRNGPWQVSVVWPTYPNPCKFHVCVP